MRAFAAVLLLTALAAPAAAQTGTDIFLAPLTWRGDTLSLGRPENVTRRPGYDNQPGFLPDSKGFLYAAIADSGGQADVYRYDLGSRISTRITSTRESEFSPTVMPGDSTFSVVRVERDSTQRLWCFSMAGGNPRLLLPDVKPVGYHAWCATGTAALFILGEPHSLHLASIPADTSWKLADGIGRCLQRIPARNALSFVHKVSEKEWWIKGVDLASRETVSLVLTRPGSEDYVWTPDGALLMAEGNRLYRWKPEEDPGWREIASFSEPGLEKILRLAMSRDAKWLAMVGEEPAGE